MSIRSPKVFTIVDKQQQRRTSGSHLEEAITKTNLAHSRRARAKHKRTQKASRARSVHRRRRRVFSAASFCSCSFVVRFSLVCGALALIWSGNMKTGVILCQTTATLTSDTTSFSRPLDLVASASSDGGVLIDSEWPRVRKFNGSASSAWAADDLGAEQPMAMEIDRIVLGHHQLIGQAADRPNNNSAAAAATAGQDARANSTTAPTATTTTDASLKQRTGGAKGTRPTRQLQEDPLREAEGVDMDTRAAESQQHKQSECALILKRTYILDDENELAGAAAASQARPSNEAAALDEWGERFVFNDSDPEDEAARRRGQPLRRASSSGGGGGNKKKVHKSDLCIKHSDVDKAIEEAKHKIRFARPADVDGPEASERSIATVGELYLAAGSLLSKRFDLSHDEILNALPMIDMMATSLSPAKHQRNKHHEHPSHLEQLCPARAISLSCSARARYRQISGQCNNLKHASWGAAKTPYSRYLPPDYADGLSAPRASRDGRPLPSARLISSLVHHDVDEPSHDYSIAFADWGQLLNHDITRVAVGEAPDCCPQTLKGLCMPIPVPANDQLYSRFQVKCLKFERALAAIRPKCLLGHRAQINLVTSPVDASFVYGSSEAQAHRLRAHSAGKMKVWNYFEKLKLKPLLPPKTDKPDQDCLARPKELYCFDAGDVRVNEQTHLTVLHTVYLREHNRIAKHLAALNMEWDDERIYQETRHIVAAGMQHVMMNEFAPLLLGLKHVHSYKLRVNMPGANGQLHWPGYDPSVTISTGTGFAAAAFRYGHSMIEGVIRRLDPNTGHLIKRELLRFLFKRPFWLYEPGAIDQLIAGMLLTPSEQTDPYMSEELSGHLFQPPKTKFGHDLAAINIQRGRDTGVPGYNDWREWCGFERAKTFSDLEPLLMNKTAWQYSKIYKHVDDIDLWSAGISERKLPGSAVGPTMACIIARQFLNYKRGDRFWYENPGQPSSFTQLQLKEIKKITLAKILCTNADELSTIQPWAMRLPHPVYNAKVPCESLPQINLKHWDSSLVDNLDK